MNPKAAAAQQRIQEWRVNPCKFVYDVFQATPDGWQERVLQEAGRPGRKRIAMKACAGPGKSTILAWLGWHRLMCFAEKDEHPKGAAISITRENLASNLWSEMAKWQNRSEMLKHAFEYTASKIYARDHADTWFLTARGFPKTADGEAIGGALSGLHSQFPFTLIDESGDMPPQVLKSAEQALSTCEDGLQATAGNPTSTSGLLYQACNLLRAQWWVCSITGDPDDPLRSPRIDMEWARQQIAQWGRDNPWVMAFILGQFPPGSMNSIIGIEEVEAAMKRHLKPDLYDWSQKRLGVDVARFGDDRTVIFPRQGLASFLPVEMRHRRDSPVSVDIATRTIAAKLKFGSEMEFFDDTVGWAHGAIDVMRANGHSPTAVDFGGPAMSPKYYNRRAEMWLTMVEKIRAGMALPNIHGMIPELSTPLYWFDKGTYRLEEKDQIKKRLGRSPDLADALALTFAIPDMPASLASQHPGLARQGNFAQMEYDVFGGDR